MALRPISPIRSFETPNLQEVENVSKNAVLPPPPAPPGLGAVKDSLSSAAADPLLKALLLNQTFNSLNEEDTALTEKQALKWQKKHKTLAARQKTLIDEKTQKTSRLSKWHTASDIASYAASAITLAAGIGFCASPAGAVALTAAGALGLVSKLMGDTGGWKWAASKITTNPESRKKLASHLETAGSIASVGASLASGIFSGGAGFWPTAVSTAANTASATASIGGDITQASVLKTESSLKQTEGEKKVISSHFALESERLKSLSDFNKDTITTLSSMVEQNFLWV